MGILQLNPVEPVLLPVVGPETGALAFRAENLSFVMPPAFHRLIGGESRPLPDESGHALERSQRPIDPRRADFERIATLNRLIHIETVREPAAEGGAVT